MKNQLKRPKWTKVKLSKLSKSSDLIRNNINEWVNIIRKNLSFN